MFSFFFTPLNRFSCDRPLLEVYSTRYPIGDNRVDISQSLLLLSVDPLDGSLSIEGDGPYAYA